jgi:hypothetical protein
MKNLRVNQTTKALRKKKKPIANFNDSAFDSVRDMGRKTFLLDEDATGS